MLFVVRGAAHEMSEPDIALVTVTYNNPLELSRTIRSVRAQTRLPRFWAVVDSSNSEFQLQNRRMATAAGAHYIWTPPRGIYPAMLQGIAELPSRYFVWFLNATDRFLGPRSFEETVSEVESRWGLAPDTVWFQAGVVATSGSELERTFLPTSASNFIQSLLEGRVGMPHPASIIRSDVVRRSGLFATDIHVSADYALANYLFYRHGLPEILDLLPVLFSTDGMSRKRGLKGFIERAGIRAEAGGAYAIANQLFATNFAIKRFLSRKGLQPFDRMTESEREEASVRFGHFCKGRNNEQWPFCCESALRN